MRCRTVASGLQDRSAFSNLDLLRERPENRCRPCPRQPERSGTRPGGQSPYKGRMSRYYNGPVSDHFDGERFFDPNGVPPRSRRELLRWRFGRQSRKTRAKWPAWAPSPYADHPPARVEGPALAHLLCRPCELPHSDRGPQYPARSGLVEAGIAVSLYRAETRQRRRASPSRNCRRSTTCWSATATTTISTSSTLSRLAAAHRRAGDHAARQ